jgi:sigma-B regulation protein RsbU (phosphoserine phosphatase)
MEKAEKAISSLRNKLILIMGFLLLIMVIVIDRVTVAMLKPLLALHDGVAKVAKGDLSFHQAEVSSDEVGDLAKAFNKMTENLKVYIKNLQETTAAKERIESELNIAREIQLSILPKIFPPFPGMPGLDLFAVLKSAREVGGDLYDFFAMDDDHFCFVIGDVSGKGVPASLFMAVTKTLFKATAVKDTPPEVILDKVNNELSKGNEKAMFVTAFFAILDTKTGVIEFSNGGHNLPVVIRKDGSAQYLWQTGGMVVGAMEGMKFERGTLTLAPGDRFFLYTDGVTEAMDENKVLFSDERLLRELKLLEGLPVKEVLNRLLALLVEYSRGDQSDDITMMLLEYQGPKQNWPSGEHSS